ncbi:MAG: class I SAM-dependent methyltransferase [Cyanobacteria bacterium J06632_19]
MVQGDRYSEYDTWAWLYNHTMGPQYGLEQLKPLEIMLLPKLPEGADLLDLCCGTGHLMQQLLEGGYKVRGLDGSEAMLNYAHQNAPEGEFILGDARTFNLPESFDGVISTSASLNHILSLEELKTVFKNVYTALKPNGLFLFDLNHAGQMRKWWKSQVAEGEIETQFAWFITPNYDTTSRMGNFRITLFEAPTTVRSKSRWKKLLYRLLSLKLLTRFRLKVLSKFQQWEKNWQRFYITYKVRGYYPSEVQAALEEVGFTQVEVKTIDGKTELDNNHSAYFLCRKN